MPPGLNDPVYSFIAYHLAIGFDHIFLFMDDPEDGSIEVASCFGSSVTITTRSDITESNIYSKCVLYPKYAPYINDEVPARQTLNAEYASILATDRGFKWLLHLDIDEVRSEISVHRSVISCTCTHINIHTHT
jgi:hypothetical protein